MFSYAGNPGVGSLHRLRDAVEHGWPRPIALEEHSHAGMANRYAAGASGLPCALMRGYIGTRPRRRTRGWSGCTCPFTGEELVAVPALNPTWRSSTRRRPTGAGYVQLWGIPGVQKEVVLAARRSLVTVERIVEALELRPGGGSSGPGDRCGGRGAGRLAAVVCAWLTAPRQRLLPRVGSRISRDRERFTRVDEEHVLRGVAT